MSKKIISMMIIFAMLVPLSSAVAADENASQPTIDEILNSYHEKAVAAQTAEENGGVSTYARRSGSEKTLEQETVDELTAAGYEAYNVTAENYESLEATLQTDFSQLGLDPDSSYIVVIGGEDETASSNSSRAADTLLPPHIGSDETGSDDNSFFYQYGSVTYKMRYVTVTNADMDNNELQETSRVTLSDIDKLDDIWDTIAEYSISYAVEVAFEKLFEAGGTELAKLAPKAGIICTLISLVADIGEIADQSPFQEIDPNTWILSANTNWIRSFIEIYDTSTSEWYAVQRSTYVTMNSEMIPPVGYEGETGSSNNGVTNATEYSTYYSDATTRKLQAVQAYLGGYISFDNLDDVKYYFKNPTDPNATEVLVFTHEDPG